MAEEAKPGNSGRDNYIGEVHPEWPEEPSVFHESFDSRKDRMGTKTKAAYDKLFKPENLSPEKVIKILNEPFMNPDIKNSIRQEIDKRHQGKIEIAKQEKANDTKAYIKTLLSLFEETGIKGKNIKDNVTNWMSKDPKELRKRYPFKLCFALKMDALDAKVFLNEGLFVNAYCARDIEHVFFSFGLQFGFSYSDTVALLCRYITESISEVAEEDLANEGAAGIVCSDFEKCLEGLDVDSRNAIMSADYKEDWNDTECLDDKLLDELLDDLEDAFYKYVPIDKNDIHAKRNSTTRAHQYVMSQILNGSLNVDGFPSMVDELNNCRQNSGERSEAAIKRCQRNLGEWFCKQMKASAKNMIGYSKTPYMEYLRYRKRLSEMILFGVWTCDTGLSIEELEATVNNFSKETDTSDVGLLRITWGNYLKLDKEAASGSSRSKSNREIGVKKLAEAGVTEIPNKAAMSEARKDYTLFSHSDKGRSLLFLMFFFYKIYDCEADFVPETKNQLCRYTSYIKFHKENFYCFMSDLHELAESCGLPVPYPRRNFDYLLLQAMYSPVIKYKLEKLKAKLELYQNYSEPEICKEDIAKFEECLGRFSVSGIDDYFSSVLDYAENLKV